MTIDNEKTAFTGGNTTFVDSKEVRFENKTSSKVTKVDLKRSGR